MPEPVSAPEPVCVMNHRPSPAFPPLELVLPGRLDYSRGLALQAELRRVVEESRGARAFLVLLEHDPVYTLGRNADARHLRAVAPLLAGYSPIPSPASPTAIPVIRTDRGGEVTYHGPGQLVGYPILSLRAYGLTVRRLVCALERALIAVLAARGVAARRREGTAGIWVASPAASSQATPSALDRKLASIGLRIARGISSHGFALNVTTDLRPFAGIDPCGDPAQQMTSLALETGATPSCAEIGDEFAARFEPLLRAASRQCSSAVRSRGEPFSPDKS